MTEPISRRRFLISSALASASSTVFDPLANAGKLAVAAAGAPNPAAFPEAVTGTGYVFLNSEEVSFLDAAVARLIPADALGDGALEAGCVLFLDRQLAGPFGAAAHLYMQGPWPRGDAQQGLQSKLTPAQTYRAAIPALNQYCRDHYSVQTFSALDADRQDRVLEKLESGTVELPGMPAARGKEFFAMLLQNTIEGFFSDPLYGGNRNMTGWKLIGFPGARYGAKALSGDMSIQDWGVTYEQLEPWYEKFEYLCGIGGKAGNLRGVLQDGGNPFEGVRQNEFPNPPMQMTYGPTLFAAAARELGYQPFPQPSANMSQAYTNPLGAQLEPCTYCGFCERFGCGNYSKAIPQTTIHPVLLKKPNFTLKTGCEVTKINQDSTGTRAVSVSYVDLEGREWEQPAELVILCAYGLQNVRLLLNSGIGTPYDPRTGTGVVGKNYAYQITSSVDVFFDDKLMNPFIGSGALGMVIDEFNGDNFDHAKHDFIGGGFIYLLTTNGRPIETHPVPEGTPNWGSKWKKAVADSYLRSVKIGTHGGVTSHRHAYLDLDPTYRDVYGQPLLRMTFDFQDNELNLSRFLTTRAEELARAMRPREIRSHPRTGHYDIEPYQTTHNTGGAIMGDSPATSVVNSFLQCWTVPNVFVTGACAFPQQAGYNPTATVAALAYRSADAIKTRYVLHPGALE